MKKIGYVTGSRADYGIVRHFLKLLEKNSKVKLEIIVTGALLDIKYGRQISLIYEDGFKTVKEIPVSLDSSSNEKTLHTMAEIMWKFATFFCKNQYDLVIILGDRYEMLPVAISAVMQRIPILHIHGGEATYGNYDEFIRHAITKMSLYHFTATEEYKKRVIQLGENPQNVFNLGALGAENCSFIDKNNVTDTVKNLGQKNYFVVLFHPETLSNANVVQQIKELLKALQHFSEQKVVFLGVNADTYSDLIRNQIRDFVRKHENATYYENLHTDTYHYLLENAICLIGNSSSGLIEAPSLGIFTINIGDRQKGRVRGNSVIDVRCLEGEIVKAMETVLYNDKNIKFQNPYYQKNSAEKYYKKVLELLERVDKDVLKPKEFYNLNMNDIN